jgi:acyl-CoA synthetase (AMP-forming)/AMP-acid ligase II
MKDWINLGKLTTADTRLDRVALIDCFDPNAPKTYTRRQLEDLVDACARGLMRQGLQRGDHVGILSANRGEFIVAYLAVMRAGMVAVPINYKLTPEAVRFILEDCRAKVCFVDRERADHIPQGVPAISFDGEEWLRFLDHGPFEVVVPAADECAMILYTSGSTGRPKGVQLSHSGQIWTLKARFNFRDSYADERFIVAAPLFHMNALTSCKFALCADASMVLMPRFEAKAFIRNISALDVTWVTSVPTMMALVVRETEALASVDTDKVRYIRMGSAPATEQLYTAVQKAFPKASLAGGYGATETGPIVFGPLPGKPLPGNGGLGWPLPDVRVKLVSPESMEVDEGELWVWTPANMLGYLNMPEKTAEVLTPDGWYKTSDVFRRDAAGCYHFVGRVDDMFVCGGENIYPSEVEHIIERIPEVMQACVVPVPDELKGHKPVAFVALRPGAQLTQAQLKEFVLANAPAYQHPRHVHFVDTFPLTATNKVDRKELERRALAAFSKGSAS